MGTKSKMGVLTVVVVKITNLKEGMDTAGESDPYVLLELEKDNLMFDKSFGEKKTSVKMNDLNPFYNETFKFEGVPDLDKMILKVKVFDKDTKKDDKLGKADIELSKYDLFSGEAYDGCWTIDSSIFSKKARVYLTLQFTE